MAKKKGGLIARLIIGSEKSEGFARSQLPSNRWELFWDVLKGRLGKLAFVNVLMVIFCLPLLFFLFIKNGYITQNSVFYPFSQNVGVGFPGAFDLSGYQESLVFSATSTINLVMPIVIMIASIGLAGGAYIIRNIVWTEGIFVSNDFWRGIKQNIGIFMIIALIFSLYFTAFQYALSYLNYLIAVGSGNTVFNSICIVYIFSICFNDALLYGFASGDV